MAILGRAILGSASWATAETWGRTIIGFAVFVVLARFLEPAEMGLATLALLVPTLLSIPIIRGIPEALIQRQQLEPIHLDSAFWLLVAGGAVLSLGVLSLSNLIALAFGEPTLVELVRWTSLIIIVSSVIAVPEAVLKRHLNFRVFALRALIGTSTGGTVGIAMAATGYGVWSVIAMYLVGVIVEAVVIFVGGMWRPRLRYSHSHCRQLFGFTAPVIIQAVVAALNDAIPKFFLGMFAGSAAVGFYTIARKPVDLLITLLMGPVNAVVMPAASRVQEDPATIGRLFDVATRFSAFIGFPAFIGFAAIAPVLVPLVFGAQWAEAVVATQIICFVGLLRVVDGPCANIILAMGRSGLLLKFHLAYTVFGTLAFAIAARAGLEATMLAIVLMNLILVPIFLSVAGRVSSADVHKPIVLFPRIIFATLLMFVCVNAWVHLAPEALPGFVIVAGGVVMGVAVYSIIAMVLLRRAITEIRDTLVNMRA